jgi:phosphoribosyl-AMP cyclohydrolase
MPADIAPTGSPDEVADMVAWNEQGLAVVVTQQHDSGEVLMLAWADREALAKTLKTGMATYFSRSRKRLWTKGEESGNTQQVVEVRLDCDGDAILYRVDSPGPACHQLRRSCFSHRVDADGSVHTDKPVVQGSD